MERPQDRRRERREGSHARVLLRVLGTLSREVNGRLVDLSFGGFRAVHTDQDLSVGDRVGFSHIDRAGEAVVVWTRIVKGSIESGFRILPI